MTKQGSPKKTGIVVAVLLALGLAAGCTPSASPEPTQGETEAPAAGAIAFLMPDTKVARYEAFDRPFFAERMDEICPECQVIYNVADGLVDTQMRQVEGALSAGAKVLVINPIDPTAERNCQILWMG